MFTISAAKGQAGGEASIDGTKAWLVLMFGPDVGFRDGCLDDNPWKVVFRMTTKKVHVHEEVGARLGVCVFGSLPEATRDKG